MATTADTDRDKLKERQHPLLRAGAKHDFHNEAKIENKNLLLDFWNRQKALVNQNFNC